MCKQLVIGLLGLLLGIQNIQTRAAEWRLENVRPIIKKEEGWFMAPMWSPDGKKIAFTKSKWRGIYLRNADGSGEIEEVTDERGAGLGFTWPPSGNTIFFRSEDRIKKVKLNTKESKSIITMRENITFSSPQWLSTGKLFYVEREKSSIEAEKDKFTLVFCDSMGKINKEIETDIWGGGTPSPDGKKIAYCEPHVRGKFVTHDTMQVWTTDDDGMNKKLVAEGSYLFPALWSPDNKKLLIGEGPSMFVFVLESNEKFSLGRGEKMSWSPDGEWIVYEISEDDGHNLIASEIYIIKWDGTEKTQLTDTKDLIEVKPSFSPDGKKIAFSTIDGRVFIADLVKE